MGGIGESLEIKFRFAGVGLYADEARDPPGLSLCQRIGPGRVGIVRRNLGDFFGVRHQMIRDIEPGSHPVRLPVVSDEAVYDRHRLRLHSSTRDPFAYLAASDVIELSDVLAAPVVAFDRAMLEIPLEDVPVGVDPSRSPSPRHPRLRPNTLSVRKPRQPFRRRNIGGTGSIMLQACPASTALRLCQSRL